MAITNTMKTIPASEPSQTQSPGRGRRPQGIGFDFTHREEVSRQVNARFAKKLANLLHNSLTVEAVAQELEDDPDRIKARVVNERTLYGFLDADGWHIPAFQLAENGLLPGLEQVIPRLDPELHPVAFAQWFQRDNPDLRDDGGAPLSPREWLRRGLQPNHVAQLAAHLDTL